MKDTMDLFSESTMFTIVYYDDLAPLYIGGEMTGLEVAKHLAKNYIDQPEFADYIAGKYYLDKQKDKCVNQTLKEALKLYYEASGERIQTIKMCRLLTKCGLKEAKDFCEDYIY